VPRHIEHFWGKKPVKGKGAKELDRMDLVFVAIASRDKGEPRTILFLNFPSGTAISQLFLLSRFLACQDNQSIHLFPKITQ
jgi:hypothetical protein